MIMLRHKCSIFSSLLRRRPFVSEQNKIKVLQRQNIMTGLLEACMRKKNPTAKTTTTTKDNKKQRGSNEEKTEQFSPSPFPTFFSHFLLQGFTSFAASLALGIKQLTFACYFVGKHLSQTTTNS